MFLINYLWPKPVKYQINILFGVRDTLLFEKEGPLNLANREEAITYAVTRINAAINSLGYAESINQDQMFKHLTSDIDQDNVNVLNFWCADHKPQLILINSSWELDQIGYKCVNKYDTETQMMYRTNYMVVSVVDTYFKFNSIEFDNSKYLEAQVNGKRSIARLKDRVNRDPSTIFLIEMNYLTDKVFFSIPKKVITSGKITVDDISLIG